MKQDLLLKSMVFLFLALCMVSLLAVGAPGEAEAGDSPYIGEITMFVGSNAPTNWAICDGRLLQVNQYMSLFSIIGTAYGGDGQTTFGIPDMRGRFPIADGGAYYRGFIGGYERVSLTEGMLPAHSHTANASKTATKSAPAGNFWATHSNHNNNVFSVSGDSTMSDYAIGAAGGGGAHDNMPPYTVLNFIMALNGIYPPRH